MGLTRQADKNLKQRLRNTALSAFLMTLFSLEMATQLDRLSRFSIYFSRFISMRKNKLAREQATPRENSVAQ